MKKYRYIFGPVPSRRLGRSLGVDLVPYKTCSYDCLYCQLGVTTDKIIQRKEYVPQSAVLAELEEKLAEGEAPDYITLSGSGEPTLHSGIGEIIAGIKKITDIPVAVLTNGSLLWMPEVRRELLSADLVVPSLDAGTPELFQRINRPHPDITFDKMVEGLILFRKEYTGPIWLEVLFLEDVSEGEDDINKIKEWIEKIRPDKIQINTATRPTAEESARPLPEEKLNAIAGFLGHKAEVIASYREVKGKKERSLGSANVLSMLSRRPCTLGDIASGLVIHRNEAVKYIDELLFRKKIAAERVGEKTYYKVLTK